MRSRLGVFIIATLAALLTALLTLTACLNPISAVFPENTPGTLSSPKTPGGGTSPGIPGGEPFTLDIWVESPDDAARSSIGPTGGRIRENSTAENGWSGIRNVVQLVVVDDETGDVADFQEVLKGSDNQETTTLVVTGLTYGGTYKFLMLMGHKNRDYADPSVSEDTVAYTSDPPTLLAAGFKSQSVSRGQKITITMYPVVVDTKFTSAGVPVEAVLEGKLLQPAAWNIAWEVTGLQALKAADPGGDIFVEARPVVWDRDNDAGAWAGIPSTPPISPLPAVNDNGVMEIILNVSAYDRVENRNSANFNVEYLPFPEAGWSGWNASPVWIIRNGINDAPQDAYTSFASGTTWGGGAAAPNGNGAVRFSVKPSFYVSSTGDDGWAGTSSQPFATLAAAYPAALDDLVRKQITFLSDLDAGDHPMMLEPPGVTADEEITITSDVVRRMLTRTGGGDTWETESMEGSNLKTRGPSVVRVTAGAEVVFRNIVINGRPYRTGNDEPIKDAEAEAELAAEPVYSRALRVEGTVTLEEDTVLTGKAKFPFVRGPAEGNFLSVTVGGESNAGGGIFIDAGGSVTMKGNSTITGSSAGNGGGVSLQGGASLTMYDTSTVSGNKAHNLHSYLYQNLNYPTYLSTFGNGGGVYVYDVGSVTMYDNSAISGNKATACRGNGGGVYVVDNWDTATSVTMNGNSAISGNTAMSGGGVYIDNTLFTMNGHSTVSGNKAFTGGGVFFDPEPVYESGALFTMNNDSSIKNNHAGAPYFDTVPAFDINAYFETFGYGNDGVSNILDTYLYGGGVVLYHTSSSSFKMNDNSVIYGSGDASWQNTAESDGTAVLKYSMYYDASAQEVITDTFPVNDTTVTPGNYRTLLDWE
jgi:hypothetical protein